MRSACVCIAIVTLAASSAWSQGNPIGAAAPQAPIGPPQAPIGHRQPTVKDLPPDVARDEKPVDGSRGEPQPESVSPRGKNVRARADGPSRGQNVRASAGGPPPLNVGPSCDAASRGAVILGRDKKACLADETTAQDTLKQNWSEYATAYKSECIGMVTTGGGPVALSCCPASRSCETRATSAIQIQSRAMTARSARVAAGANSAVPRVDFTCPRDRPALVADRRGDLARAAPTESRPLADGTCAAM
jgi:hypothetical protein